MHLSLYNIIFEHKLIVTHRGEINNTLNQRCEETFQNNYDFVTEVNYNKQQRISSKSHNFK